MLLKVMPMAELKFQFTRMTSKKCISLSLSLKTYWRETYQHILYYASFVDHSLDALTTNEYRRKDARGVISGL